MVRNARSRLVTEFECRGFAANIFHRDGGCVTQVNVTVESVQQWYSVLGIPSATCTDETMRASKTETHSSKRGILGLSGATFDLAASNVILMEPSRCITLRYTMAPYAWRRRRTHKSRLLSIRNHNRSNAVSTIVSIVTAVCSSLSTSREDHRE